MYTIIQSVFFSFLKKSVLKALINKIFKAGDITYSPNEQITALRRDMSLEQDYSIDLKDGKNWSNPNIPFFKIENGVWYFKNGLNWNGVSFGGEWTEWKDDPNHEGWGILWESTLLHDCGYFALQNDSKNFPYTRKQIDKIFYNLMKKVEFRYASLYYHGVRLFGWVVILLGKTKRIIKR